MSFGQLNFLKKWAGLYNGTPAEHALEPAIASLGVPYRFQHPVWALGLFPDFVLLKERLVIEVDDASHRTAAKRKADQARTQKLAGAGWKVVRCTNEEAINAPYATVNRLMAEANLPYRAKPQE